MNESIIEAIDAEIVQLQQARSILLGSSDVLTSLKKPGRGRPKGSKNAVKATPVKAKRVLSAEGKAKIATAQKKRWAATKRAAKKAATEQSE